MASFSLALLVGFCNGLLLWARDYQIRRVQRQYQKQYEEWWRHVNQPLQNPPPNHPGNQNT